MTKDILKKGVRGFAEKSRKIGTLFLVLTTILWALGVPLGSFLPGLPVQTALAVSTVLGMDSDTTGPGLDGRDFSIAWTPGTQPAGYTDTQIFIFPAAMDPLPTAGNVLTTGCSGGACQPRGFFTQYQQPNAVLPQFTTIDSAGAPLAAGNYKACVLTSADADSFDCTAAAFTVASDDDVTDASSPMIDHMSVGAAQESTDAVINAFVIDDQTTEAQFANVGDGEQEYFKLAYGANLVSAETRVNAVSVSGKLFQFTVPGAAVPAAGGAFQYYVTAKDRAGNESFFCANPSAATSTACKAAPFIVNTVAAGSRSIAGTIKFNTSSGTPSALASAKVFPAGFAKAAVTAGTGGSAGVYTITGLPNNTPIDVTAYLVSYTKNIRTEMIGAANLTSIDINLNVGEMGFYSGGGGGMFAGDMSPHVIFSGPPDNGQNVMLNENIKVGITQPLNAQTVNDSDASNAGSNVYLTSDGTTKIAGTTTWCQSNSSPGCSVLMSMDTNTILFNPTADLTANTFYTLVITEAVTSESGQSIAGNRSGGGHRINFTTSAGVAFTGQQMTDVWSNQSTQMNGANLPPYVKSTLPAPGNSVAPNTNVLVEFNETMGLGTLTSTNVKLVKLPSTPVTSTVSVDSTETRFVTLNPSSDLTSGDYEIQVLGAVANARGMTMRTGAEASSIAFRTNFTVAAGTAADITPPTIYPLVASGGTITVNEGTIQFGFSEPLAAGTITSSNITLKRGSTAVTASIVYNASENSVYIIPEAALMPNTSYNVTFGTSVTDLAGVVIDSDSVTPGNQSYTYTYTTGAADTVAPKLKEARCDDYTCTIFFNEPMNHETAADTNYANSVLKQANWTVERTAPSATVIDISGKPTTYNGEDYSVTIQGVVGLAFGDTFRVTANAVIQDLAKNGINTTSSANILVGAVENSQATFGSFGDTGMFGPPVAGVGSMGPPVAGSAGASVTLGGEFKPQGFGTFTADQFAMGQADMAYPFNPMASQSSNVFQVRFSPGAVLATGDLVELTFPKGTGISSVVEDTFSPYSSDFNEAKGAGTVTYDDTYDTDGIAADTTAMTVTVRLAITGTPGSADSYVIDLKGITNPSVPKGPESGGYTVGIKVKRGTPAEIVVNKTSMPYFIMAGGSRTITVKVYTGSTSGIAGATGNVHLWGGGPGGPMDKLVGLTNGITTAADGTAIAADAGIVYSNLPDGCYNFGTEPLVTLNSLDYYGQMSPEPVCVNSGVSSVTKNIILTAASGAGTVDLTVKLAGIADFGGVDVDIFAGGPGKYVVKTLSALGAPAGAGYTLTLNANGPWNIGIGPSMSKGASTSMPRALPGIAPPPTNIIVSGLPGTGAIAAGFNTPSSVSINTTTKTITFTFAAADKTVTGTVNDGTTALANVNVFMHAQGFGQPAFTTTKSDGTFSLSVSGYGSYEIGVMKDGLPPVMKNIEIRTDGADAGTDPDIFFKGKQITGGNPLVISLKKGAYTISGKVLDSSNNGISYAPVFATDANGNSANGGTSSDGSYSIFVDAGTWTVKSMMPPDKTDGCGTFEKTVTITTESKSSQNITPSTGTCYTLSGTVTLTGVSTLNNVPVSVNEWDTTNNRPVMGGMFKGTSTSSSGVYTVKVKGSATYRISTWDPTYGELSATQAITTADVTNAHITSGATGVVTMAFTGGSSSHDAFIELKKSDDSFTRLGKTQKGLASNVTFTMKEGTYNYFVDVFGVGKYSGTVVSSATSPATATIDLSSSTLVTLSGNIKDDASANLSGALVTAKSSDGTVKTTTTDASGNYSLSVKAGTYTVNASKAEYVAGQAAASVALTTTTANYDFGGATPDQIALQKTDQVITGTVYQSNGSTAATNAFVTATESTTGATVTAPVDAVTGVYSLPVDDGTWTVKAVAPLHAKTTKSGTVTVAGTTDSTGSTNNITLTADATKSSVSTSASLSAASGGSINDTGSAGTGLKLTAGQGVLEAGNVTVTMDVEKTFTAPDTDTFTPLASAAFAIEAQNVETESSIKDLKGNAEIQIDYTSLLSSLPNSVSEANLKLVYYSTEKDAYVPVEGGFTVDAANNTITGQVDHLTDFAIVYSPVSIAVVGSSSGDTTPPAVPSGVTVSSGNSKATLNWTDPTDSDLYRIEILRNAGGNTPVSGEVYAYVDKGVKTFVDTAVTVGATYKYQIRVRDFSLNSRLTDEYSIAVTAPAPGGGGSSGSGATTTTPTTTPVVTTPTTTTTTPATTVTSTPAATAAPVAVLIKDPTKLDEILSGLSVTRSQSEEAKYMPLIKSDAIAYKVGLTEDQKTALTNFVTYGISAKTKALGAGERRALVRDYLETVGRANVNWEDMDRLAKGEKPVSRNLAKEQAKVNTVLAMFKKMVGHMPNFKDTDEDLSWNTMMYRIRFERDLVKEKVGIVEFKQIFKYTPKSPLDWSAVRALGYVLP